MARLDALDAAEFALKRRLAAAYAAWRAPRPGPAAAEDRSAEDRSAQEGRIP
jgi:hypothetical protein